MPTNKFFNNTPKNLTTEQWLVDDLITEVVQINGMDCYYILRDSQSSLDLVMGEDPTTMFKRAYLMEMLLDNPEGSVSGGDLLSKFGLQITDSSNFVISHRAFEKYVPKQFRNHPIEGDLIYVPVMNQTFEIKKVEEEQNFYSLGKRDPFFYNLKAQTFQFSQESFETGIDEVDTVQSDVAYLISVPLSGGTINFQRGELLYKGSDPSTSIATAKVDEWFPSNNTLHIYYTKGEFQENDVIKGQSSGAEWTVEYYDDRKNASRYDAYQNDSIIEKANSIIDMSVTNVFGQPTGPSPGTGIG